MNQEITDWFLSKADPDHAPIYANGVRWWWKDNDWHYEVVDKSWREYWDRGNQRALDGLIANDFKLMIGFADEKQVSSATQEKKKPKARGKGSKMSKPKKEKPF